LAAVAEAMTFNLFEMGDNSTMLWRWGMDCNWCKFEIYSLCIKCLHTQKQVWPHPRFICEHGWEAQMIFLNQKDV